MLELFSEFKFEKPKKGIAVDCGCMGNPGKAEFRGIDIETGEILFEHKIPGLCTNNIAEFLAIVRAYKYIQEHNLELKIYSDSQTAISWWNKRKHKSKLINSESTKTALHWLNEAIKLIPNNRFELIEFWSNKEYGETPADYGRK